jgi:hypothetical protein
MNKTCDQHPLVAETVDVDAEIRAGHEVVTQRTVALLSKEIAAATAPVEPSATTPSAANSNANLCEYFPIILPPLPCPAKPPCCTRSAYSGRYVNPAALLTRR